MCRAASLTMVRYTMSDSRRLSSRMDSFEDENSSPRPARVSMRSRRTEPTTYFWMTSPSMYADRVEAGRTTTVPDRVEADNGSHLTWRTLVVAL